MLKFKMQTICYKLMSLLLGGSESSQIIEKIFRIFKMVKEFHESFLHFLLPNFFRILNNSKLCENITMLRGIINYLKTILDLELSKLWSLTFQPCSTPRTLSTR